MNHGHTKDSLIRFEEWIKQSFLAKQIRAPVHFSGGNEEELLGVFQYVRPDDWVFSTWRSHYHALLKGVPENDVYEAILDGRSMYLMFREHRFFSSAIVGGTLPIALGVAGAIKRDGGPGRVWVFVGDMCARTGIYHEAVQYATGHALPLRVVIEDNQLSTNAPTEVVWGQQGQKPPTIRYRYTRTFPHVGLEERVNF